jgi:DNA polymerase-1
VQAVHELPNLLNANELFLDFETTSFDPKEEAFKPYHGHRICGICITADNIPDAWYVPIRHTHAHWNLPVDNVRAWLRDILDTAKIWINHRVKFDMHFAHVDGLEFQGKVYCTETLAKLIDSDRFTYGLKALAEEWLELEPYTEDVEAYLKGCKSKNYGDVPADILGEYGCNDVLRNRMLWRYIQRRLPEDSALIFDIETRLTPVLFDMEVEGMRVDPIELQTQELSILTELIQIEESIAQMTGRNIRPHTNPDCFDILCNQYGLPVLGYTDAGEPSFDKDTLISYLSHPDVVSNEFLTNLVGKIQRYRKRNTLLSFFVKPYQEHQVDGVMHPEYNQIIRTGRMSCKRPNSQQLSPEAKELIHPPAGHAFIRFDYSQIEFRLIVHYIKDLDAIRAYEEDPWTDFHSWVAQMCGIPRKPAKNVNFCIGYGGGKNKVISMLASNMDLVGSMGDVVDKMIAEGKIKEDLRQQTFNLLCHKRGEDVYNTYHSTLPGLRRTSRQAARNLELRGYVFNAYGRRRHLPAKVSFRAFNTINQSCAADVMKDRTIDIAPRYNSEMRALGIKPIASVHDETLFIAPIEVANDVSVLVKMAKILEDTRVKFRVPIKISCGTSDKNWKIASSDDGDVPNWKILNN